MLARDITAFLRHHTLQASMDRHMAELQGELQVTRFEKERTGLVHQETIKDLRHLQLEQEKLHKKVRGHCQMTCCELCFDCAGGVADSGIARY